jgi:hypothetical protein
MGAKIENDYRLPDYQLPITIGYLRNHFNLRAPIVPAKVLGTQHPLREAFCNAFRTLSFSALFRPNLACLPPRMLVLQQAGFSYPII